MSVIHDPGCWSRRYWLGHCEGFRVEDETRRLGYVEEILGDEDEPGQLVVRGGLFANRAYRVPMDAVEVIEPQAQRVLLRRSSVPQVSVDRTGPEATRLAGELEPTAHVEDGPAEYRVEVDAPGLGADDFEVRLSGRLLQVSGLDLRRLETDSTFEFVFRLPDHVDGQDLAAAFEEGKLVVRASMKEDEPRRIEIRRPKPSP